MTTGANYRLSSLLMDKDFTSYEYGISRIISKISDPGAQAGGMAKGSVGAYLPSGLFLRDLGINNAGAVVATGRHHRIPLAACGWAAAAGGNTHPTAAGRRRAAGRLHQP